MIVGHSSKKCDGDENKLTVLLMPLDGNEMEVAQPDVPCAIPACYSCSWRPREVFQRMEYDPVDQAQQNLLYLSVMLFRESCMIQEKEIHQQSYSASEKGAI